MVGEVLIVMVVFGERAIAKRRVGVEYGDARVSKLWYDDGENWNQEA